MNSSEPISIIYSRGDPAVGLMEAHGFVQKFVEQQQLLPRSMDEIKRLMQYSFTASANGDLIGFVALEIYSPKLSEIQCLAVDSDFQRLGIGRELVNRCVALAGEMNVLELMAISNSDEMFLACGFDYSLPNQKRALFIQPESSE